MSKIPSGLGNPAFFKGHDITLSFNNFTEENTCTLAAHDGLLIFVHKT
jgi:hypothetical protein